VDTSLPDRRILHCAHGPSTGTVLLKIVPTGEILECRDAIWGFVRRSAKGISPDRVRDAKTRVTSVRRNREIPPVKAVEELSSCITILGRTDERFFLAQALHIRAMAYASGMEDHPRAFRDWRRASGIVAGSPRESPEFRRLGAHIRFNMGLHASGPVRIRYYDQALRLCREAGWRQGEATVLVHRGLERKERGERRKALRDLEVGLKIARERRMKALRQLRGFIRETESLPQSPT